MNPVFPPDRQGKRKVLMEAVAEVRGVLAAGADQAEQDATLPEATVNALYDSGLLRLKLPAELGGAEADPVTQLEVIEALARIDGSAAWCTMIGATSIASPGAFLPDEAINEMFVDGRPPKGAGVFSPSGTAVSTEGGYLLTGRWSFASGVRHSQWVSAGARVERDGGATAEHLRLVFPTAQVEIHDNWQVAGLQGTGSNDFSVSQLFVPERFAWDPASTSPRRGGPLFRMGLPGLVANEHAAFALGVGRQALDEITWYASTGRGYSRSSSIGSRASFQRALGECDLRLRAARSLVIEILEEAWAEVCDGLSPGPRLQTEMRSSATFATQVAADVTSIAFRYGGGRVMYKSNVLQRCLRDINAAAQHYMVNDTSFENHGQCLLGMPDVDPMA